MQKELNFVEGIFGGAPGQNLWFLVGKTKIKKKQQIKQKMCGLLGRTYCYLHIKNDNLLQKLWKYYGEFGWEEFLPLRAFLGFFDKISTPAGSTASKLNGTLSKVNPLLSIGICKSLFLTRPLFQQSIQNIFSNIIPFLTKCWKEKSWRGSHSKSNGFFCTILHSTRMVGYWFPQRSACFIPIFT